MQNKIRVYVAGPLNAMACDYLQNVSNMIKTARKIRDLGCSVYIPCTDLLEGIVNGDFTYDMFFENSQPWLLCADCIYLCGGWETSDGTKREIKFAIDNNITVIYNLEDLKLYLKGK